MDFSERRVFASEIRESAREGRYVEGVAAPYRSPTPIGTYVEVLEPGCFTKSISEAALALPLLAMHNSQAWPVGKAVEWSEDDDALRGVWEFASTEEADTAHMLVRDGFVGGLSVGFMPVRSRVEPGTDTEPPVVCRVEAMLAEVSLVPAPAYAQAVVTLVRTKGPDMPRPNWQRWKKWAERNLDREA